METTIIKDGRNLSMDILKYLAAIFIINSHMKLLYYPYEALAGGGAIGDTLFSFTPVLPSVWEGEVISSLYAPFSGSKFLSLVPQNINWALCH